MAAIPERSPVVPDDLFDLAFLQTGRLSPDGSRVVYAVSHVESVSSEEIGDDVASADAVERKEFVTLRLLSLRDGSDRPLTTGTAKDTAPRWSPDGGQIAFLSDRSEKTQIYLLPVDGGEARQLTRLPEGVGSAPVWSPDGRMIAFTAGPQTPPRADDTPYRVTRPVYRFDALGLLDAAAQDLYVIDTAGDEPTQLTDDGWMNSSPQWSPDGDELLFTAGMNPDVFRAFRARLRLVDLAGETRDLTGDWQEIAATAWLPDGRRVACIGKPVHTPMGSKSDLWIVDRADGTVECRTAGHSHGVGNALQPDMAALLDHRVPTIAVNSDGTGAVVRVQIGGSVQLTRIALHGPEQWDAVADGERSCFLLDHGDSTLLFAAGTLCDPPDLHVVDWSGTNERKLTTLNPDWQTSKLQPEIRNVRFSGVDGTEVEGWYLAPPAGEAPHPTILYIHGGPHSGFGHLFSFDFQMLVGAGYGVLIVNQRGSTGYGDDFATQIIGDWGNLDYEDLMSGLDHAIALGLADPERLGCCGLSGGGNLSCWIVGQTDRFKAAVPENPVTNWVSFYGVSDIGAWFAVEELGGKPHEIPEVYARASPVTYAHRCTTPTLLIQGEADYRCPAEQSEQFYTVLKASGCPVEMVRLPGASHAGSIFGLPAIRQAQNDALLDWMNRYLSPGGDHVPD